MSRKERKMVRTPEEAEVEAAELGDMDDLFVLDTTGTASGAGAAGAKKKGSDREKKKADRKVRKATGSSVREAEWERILFGSIGGGEADGSVGEGAADVEQSAAGRDDSDAGSDDGALAAARGPQRPAVLKEKRAVWHDDDDETITIDLSGKQRLRKLRKSEDETAVSGPEFVERVQEHATKMSQGVNWATRKKLRKHDADGDGLLRSGAALSGHRSAMLPAAVLEVERLKDANAQDTSDSVIQVCVCVCVSVCLCMCVCVRVYATTRLCGFGLWVCVV
jgi:hypothetical protein